MEIIISLPFWQIAIQQSWSHWLPFQGLRQNSKYFILIYVCFWIWLENMNLRRPELGRLAHHFCASWYSVCSEYVEMNQIIINSIKYALCNIHIKDHFSKYFIYNDLWFILFHCDFTNNLLYDITLVDVIFRFWVTSQ